MLGPTFQLTVSNPRPESSAMKPTVTISQNINGTQSLVGTPGELILVSGLHIKSVMMKTNNLHCQVTEEWIGIQPLCDIKCRHRATLKNIYHRYRATACGVIFLWIGFISPSQTALTLLISAAL